MATSVILSGITFTDSMFSDFNYLNPVTVNGVDYPAWQAMWVAGLANLSVQFRATSGSSVSMTTGSRTFVLDTDVPFVAQQFVLMSEGDNAGFYMYGQVTSYTSATKTLVVNVTYVSGSGTQNNWTIVASGPRGSFNAAVSARTTNTALADSDNGSTILITGSGGITQTINAKATLSSNWVVFYKNASTGNVIIDPNSAETIGGQTTITLLPGDSCFIFYDGSNLQLMSVFTAYGYLSGDVPDPQNGDYVVNFIMPFSGTIDQTEVKLDSGTCTVTVKINGSSIGGSAHSATSSISTIARSSSNTFAAGDKISFTVSSFSSAVNLAYNFRFRRNL